MEKSTNTQSQNLDGSEPVERVFDITPDLNISPVSETNEQAQTEKPINKPEVATETRATTQQTTSIVNEAQPGIINQKNISSQPKPVSAGENSNPVIKPVADAEKFSKKALRTYEGDVAEFMSHNRTSTASIAIAEKAKKDKAEIINNENSNKTINLEEKTRRNKKIFLTVASIILIGGGIIGTYYLYSQSALGPRTIITQKNPATISLIPSNLVVNISIDNMSPLQIIASIQAEVAKSQSPNTVKEIILTKKDNEAVIRVNSAEMINVMSIDAPDMLVRSLATPWMLGEYSDTNGNKDIFVVVTHNFFQNAFASMLSWENVMADDLKLYFGNTRTNEATQPYSTLRGHFTDGIIKNKDAREFRTDMGNVVFLYSFIDNTKLVIASKEATLAEIISRLEQRAFVR